MQQHEKMRAFGALPVGGFAGLKSAWNGVLQRGIKLRIGQRPEQIQVSEQGMA
ncbi:MAG: hypothetical protein ACN6O5_08710 [Achromobacter sp.]|uniref:hypothetical protein n=1 Tax=unclassified Achromobacter TaxID=2626865 RepID=UPI001F3AC7A4|nr:hypothetical protein [Achromobacter sp. Root565]